MKIDKRMEAQRRISVAKYIFNCIKDAISLKRTSVQSAKVCKDCIQEDTNGEEDPCANCYLTMNPTKYEKDLRTWKLCKCCVNEYEIGPSSPCHECYVIVPKLYKRK